MVNMLSHLDDCIPIMGSKVFFALRALSVALRKLNDFSLLNLNVLIYFSFYFYLNLHSFGMRLGPYELCIFQNNFIQSFHFSKQ